MQTVDKSTMDDAITTIDFATLFSQEELTAKRAEEKDRRKKNRILSVESSHFLIYLMCLLISIALIAAYLISPRAEASKWLAVLMSLGSNGFGAAPLAWPFGSFYARQRCRKRCGCRTSARHKKSLALHISFLYAAVCIRKSTAKGH